MTTTKVSDASFDSDVLKAPGPVLVDFWAAWCGPCKMIAPALEEIATRYGVQGIPNFVVIRDGKPVFQQAGVVPHTEMSRWLGTASA